MAAEKPKKLTLGWKQEWLAPSSMKVSLEIHLNQTNSQLLDQLNGEQWEILDTESISKSFKGRIYW